MWNVVLIVWPTQSRWNQMTSHSGRDSESACRQTQISLVPCDQSICGGSRHVWNLVLCPAWSEAFFLVLEPGFHVMRWLVLHILWFKLWLGMTFHFVSSRLSMEKGSVLPLTGKKRFGEYLIEPFSRNKHSKENAYTNKMKQCVLKKVRMHMQALYRQFTSDNEILGHGMMLFAVWSEAESSWVALVFLWIGHANLRQRWCWSFCTALKNSNK